MNLSPSRKCPSIFWTFRGWLWAKGCRCKLFPNQSDRGKASQSGLEHPSWRRAWKAGQLSTHWGLLVRLIRVLVKIWNPRSLCHAAEPWRMRGLGAPTLFPLSSKPACDISLAVCTHSASVSVVSLLQIPHHRFCSAASFTVGNNLCGPGQFRPLFLTLCYTWRFRRGHQGQGLACGCVTDTPGISSPEADWSSPGWQKLCLRETGRSIFQPQLMLGCWWSPDCKATGVCSYSWLSWLGPASPSYQTRKIVNNKRNRWESEWVSSPRQASVFYSEVTEFTFK